MHFFDLLGNELLQVVEESRVKYRINSSNNATFLSLIPKAFKALSFDQYLPISPCNLIDKIITKIIPNHIKVKLDSIISMEQFSFLAWKTDS